MNRKLLIPIVIALILTVLATRLSDTTQYIRSVPVVLAWIAVIVGLIPIVSKPIELLRRIPALLWLIDLIAFVAILIRWILTFQPSAGIPISGAEWFCLVGGVYGIFAISFAGDRSSVGKIGWLAGPMITLTTLVIIIVGLEFGLRYVWVMSDNFQFSKMHKNWSRLYWNPLNEIGEGYRDFPPAPNDDRTQIIVAGDSLAAGYGINHIEDTFPHLLGDLLGDNYTVNLVAQPGWGISTALGSLKTYPTQPEIIVLSHYINDIAEGTAGRQYGQPFPAIRLDPKENQRWWVENFYIANFLFYRVYLYTQYDSVGLYNDWLRGAYNNQAVWTAYQDEMQAWIDYADSIDADLYVIVWANLLAIEDWRDVTDPIVDYFESHDIPVVDMADVLSGESPTKLTVNLFDAHPSEYSHQMAANEVYEIISGNE